MNVLTKILLFPFAFIYGLIIGLRNWLYKSNFIGSTDFEIPIISIGNLSMGGTGKTPMIELLIELLHGKYKTGVLSRGYKRKTTGYVEVLPYSNANQVGDEPLMIKLKYPAANVAVGEQRVIAIPHLLATHPDTQVILLDDAFQHQSVRPDVNILLTTYNKPFYEDVILPIGTLREFASSKNRANIIVVTKCPADISQKEQQEIKAKIKATKQQRVFFSTVEYGIPYNILQPTDRLFLNKKDTQLLLTGIANAAPLNDFLLKGSKEIIHYKYNDHHYFTLYELENMMKNYPNIQHWITTEKDAVLLALHKDWFIQHNITLYGVPIKTKIIGEEASDFSKSILGFLDYFYKEENIASTDLI